jgi:hypothetical protein
MVWLNVLREEVHILLWLGTHKREIEVEMVMVMEYLMLVTGVLIIPLTQDALKKLHSSISLWEQVKCATHEPTCYSLKMSL